MAKLSNETMTQFFNDMKVWERDDRGAFCVYHHISEKLVSNLEEDEWEELFEALAEGGNYFTSSIDGEEYDIGFDGEEKWEDAMLPIYRLLCRGYLNGVWVIEKKSAPHKLALKDALKLTSHLAIVDVWEDGHNVATIDVSNYEHRDDADKYLDYEVVRIKPYAEVGNQSKLWQDGQLSMTINTKVLIIVEKGEE